MFSIPRARFSLRLLELMRVRLDLVLERQFGSLLSERCRIRFAASRQYEGSHRMEQRLAERR